MRVVPCDRGLVHGHDCDALYDRRQIVALCSEKGEHEHSCNQIVHIEQPGDETTAPETPTSDELFEQLDNLVSRYFKELWEESGQGESGDYISSWAIVAHFANMNDPIDRPSAGYICETSPTSMPPHAMKGLFSEGIDWVDEAQHMDEDE